MIRNSCICTASKALITVLSSEINLEYSLQQYSVNFPASPRCLQRCPQNARAGHFPGQRTSKDPGQKVSWTSSVPLPTSIEQETADTQHIISHCLAASRSTQKPRSSPPMNLQSQLSLIKPVTAETHCIPRRPQELDSRSLTVKP